MTPRRSSILPATLVVLAGIVILLLGVWWGGHPGALPPPLRDALVAKDVRTTQEALDVIHDDYYRRVSLDRLVNEGIAGAVDGLHDRFSSYLDPRAYRRFLDLSRGEFSGIGTEVTEDRRGLRVTRVFRGAPAAAAGIHPGDVITAVNGESIAGKPSSVASAMIRGRPGTSVVLTVASGGRVRPVRVKRARVSAPSVSSSLRTVRGVKLGVDAVASFTSGVHGELREAVESQRRRGAKGILVDLRGNGGGLLNEAVLVASIFIDRGTIVVTAGRTRPRHVYEATGDALHGRFPIVVLVDHDTASAAEIVAAALQERRGAKVVGSHTFGKGVFQEVREISNGGALDITVGEYFTPKGRNLGGGGVREGAGIAPDVPVGPDGRRALAVSLDTLAAQVR